MVPAGPPIKRRPSRTALAASSVYSGFARIAPKAAVRVLESRNSQTFPGKTSEKFSDEVRPPFRKSKSLLLSRMLSRRKLGDVASPEQSTASTTSGRASGSDSEGDSDGDREGDDGELEMLPDRLPDRLASTSSVTSVRSVSFDPMPPRRVSYSSTVSSVDSDGAVQPVRLTSADSDAAGDFERPPAHELRTLSYHSSVASTSSINTNGLLRLALGMPRSGRRMHSINELNTALDDMQEENAQLNADQEIRRENSLKLGLGSPTHRDMRADTTEVDAANARLADALALIRADVRAEAERENSADVPGMVRTPSATEVGPHSAQSAEKAEASPDKWDEWRARKEAKAARKNMDKRPKYGELLKNGAVNTAK